MLMNYVVIQEETAGNVLAAVFPDVINRTCIFLRKTMINYYCLVIINYPQLNTVHSTCSSLKDKLLDGLSFSNRCYIKYSCCGGHKAGILFYMSKKKPFG